MWYTGPHQLTEANMAIKNLQFIVTVGVDVPDDWECPTAGTDVIQGELVSVVDLNARSHAIMLEAKGIVSIAAEFETITD